MTNYTPEQQAIYDKVKADLSTLPGMSPETIEQTARGRAMGFEIPQPKRRNGHEAPPPQDDAPAKTVSLSDFYAYMPMHQYIFVPTRELWPASSVDRRIVPWPKTPISKQDQAPSSWLDANRPLEQMTWQPGEPQIVKDRVIQVGGWVPHPGTTVFNLYRPPARIEGNATKAGPWIDHVVRIYPDDADHIIRWLAHRVQRPGEKLNHALVLGGAQGIGKDTLLEPVKAGIGPWNWQEINPAQMLGRFNAWAKAVIVRVSEARDLGDVDRFKFYDHCKVYLAAPPDVLRVDEKFLREHYIANVLAMVITTNHAGDGLYLPADDRRHYVAWSERCKDDFPKDYWTKLYGWYERGGIGHVVAYLRELDLSVVDWKAPPLQTPAFWNNVATGEAPESGELRDVIEGMDNPAALTLQQVIGGHGDEPRRTRRRIAGSEEPPLSAPQVRPGRLCPRPQPRRRQRLIRHQRASAGRLRQAIAAPHGTDTSGQTGRRLR